MINGKVSIIIPVYNVEKYLEECIISIENQDYKNFEIILIDDGSKDKTPKMCDDLSNKYGNIIVKHITNGGVSHARNLAISLSTGKYLMFIDSDDYIEKDMVSSLVEAIKQNQAELAACNYNFCYVDRIVTATFNVKKILNQEETLKEFTKNTSIRGFMCNKIFLKSIINDNDLKFNENIKICEDLLFCYQYASHLKKTVTLKKPLYNYRMRKSSASNANIEKDLSVFEAFKEIEKINKNIYEESINFYTYIYFKYYKELKKRNILNQVKNLNLLSCVFNKKITLKTKFYAILFLILPQKIKNNIKRKQKNNKQYYE